MTVCDLAQLRVAPFLKFGGVVGAPLKAAGSDPLFSRTAANRDLSLSAGDYLRSIPMLQSCETNEREKPPTKPIPCPAAPELAPAPSTELGEFQYLERLNSGRHPCMGEL